MEFPTKKREEVSASEMDLDDLQRVLGMTDEQFRDWLRSYGFAK